MIRRDFEIYRYRYMDEVELHHHDFYEIYLLLRGSVSYTVENRIFHMRAGDLMLISPLELHQARVDSNDEPYERIVLWVDRGYLESLSSPHTSLTRCFDTTIPGHTNLLRLPGATGAPLRTTVDKLCALKASKDYGSDLLGNEVGAAAKNVVGIAAGFLDGLGLVTLKGALMSRGTREVARLIRAMGGNELSAYGLCHLGDYEATVFSPYSHNRQFGECYVQGKSYTQLAEGYYTVKALVQLGKQYGVELPICQSVYHILYENADPHEAIRLLMGRDLKGEFDS